MKAILSVLLTIGLLSGVANAADISVVMTDSSIVEWCNDYRGH